MIIFRDYKIIKKTVDFNLPIIINSFNCLDRVFNRWTRALEQNEYIHLSKDAIFKKIFEDLEKKSILDFLFEYVRSCYTIHFNSENKNYKTKFATDIENEKENLIIQEFIADNKINVTEAEIDNLYNLLNDINKDEIKKYLLIKKLQTFMLDKFNWEIDYQTYINYLNVKNKKLCLDANMNGFETWKKFEKWLDKYKINYLGKKFTSQTFRYLWINHIKQYLNEYYLKIWIQNWKISKKNLHSKWKKISDENIKIFLINNIDNLIKYKNINSFEYMFEATIDQNIEKNLNFPIKKIFVKSFKKIITDILFYEYLNNLKKEKIMIGIEDHNIFDKKLSSVVKIK